MTKSIDLMLKVISAIPEVDLKTIKKEEVLEYGATIIATINQQVAVAPEVDPFLKEHLNLLHLAMMEIVSLSNAEWKEIQQTGSSQNVNSAVTSSPMPNLNAQSSSSSTSLPQSNFEDQLQAQIDHLAARIDKLDPTSWQAKRLTKALEANKELLNEMNATDDDSDSTIPDPLVQFAEQTEVKLYERDELTKWDELRKAVSSKKEFDSLAKRGGIERIVWAIQPQERSNAITQLDNSNMSVLHYAAHYPATLKTLLKELNGDEKINAIKQIDVNGKSVLHHAATNPKSLSMVLSLYDSQEKLAAVTQMDNQGLSAMHHAEDNPECMQIIMSALKPKEMGEAIKFLVQSPATLGEDDVATATSSSSQSAESAPNKLPLITSTDKTHVQSGTVAKTEQTQGLTEQYKARSEKLIPSKNTRDVSADVDNRYKPPSPGD